MTLSGQEIEAERVTCEKYGGEHAELEADYLVEAFDTTLGEDIEVRCCESCKDEFAEWVDPSKIRELRPSERWDDGE